MSDDMIRNQMERDKTLIERLEAKVDQLTKELNAFKINEQLHLVANPPIIPGISAKVAYDEHGLVVKGLTLEMSDIPQLPISHISGLQTVIDNIPDILDVKTITSELKRSIVRRSNEAVGTAVKVNYDVNGFVISGSSLLPDDIPTLPMNKIEGLVDIIGIIESLTSTPVKLSDSSSDNITRAGTYTKISVDTSGRVTGGGKLNINDLPADLISRINQIEYNMINYASSSQVDKLSKSVLSKVDSNFPVTPGTYAKVSIDSKGLVTGGHELTVDDLPSITIDYIDGLKSELNKTAKYTDIANINDALSQLVGSMPSVSDVNQLKQSVSVKAEADQVCRLEKELCQLRDNIASMTENLSVELLLKQLDIINARIDSIEGRLSVIESDNNSQK